MRKHLEITPNLEPLFGTRDENLRLMESALQARIDLQSDAVLVEGSEESIARVERIFHDYEALRRQGILLQNGELNGMLRLVTADPSVSLRNLAESGKQRSAGIKRMVQPRSLNQRRYVEAIEQEDMVFGIGPAGTGKTYLAVAMAAAALLAKKISRIVLVRPAVEAGERLGFLPGSLQEKVDPYLRPLYDALYDLLEPERVDKMLERNVIEIAPLAFMRGRTLNDAFIIMDEAQNTTSEQMKMFLTRMGNNAKAVITGDITQIDLPNPRKSGLVEAMNVLDGVDGIRFIHFEDGDVVRHHLVQRIIRAYDGFGRARQEELAAGNRGRARRSIFRRRSRNYRLLGFCLFRAPKLIPSNRRVHSPPVLFCAAVRPGKWLRALDHDPDRTHDPGQIWPPAAAPDPERLSRRARPRLRSCMGEVSVLLTGDARIRRLNRQFRRKDKPTDVLSFPAPGSSRRSRCRRRSGHLGRNRRSPGRRILATRWLWRCRSSCCMACSTLPATTTSRTPDRWRAGKRPCAGVWV